jgi:hypothetical protein
MYDHRGGASDDCRRVNGHRNCLSGNLSDVFGNLGDAFGHCWTVYGDRRRASANRETRQAIVVVRTTARGVRTAIRCTVSVVPVCRTRRVVRRSERDAASVPALSPA